MKCHNIFCYYHSLRYKENCGVIISVKGGQDRISHSVACERRKRYNKAAKSKFWMLENWEKVHAQYYGRKRK